MPERGAQFPLHNTGYFTGTAGPGNLHHESTHDVGWGTGAGAFKETLGVSHRWDPETRQGGVVLHGEGGEVASLRYRIHEAERATSLKVQPVIHTDMIQIEGEYQGSGLASHMMKRLQAAHPGVAHPASNELTEEGSAWRTHRVTRGLDNGERIAEGPWEGDSSMHGPRLFRPTHAGSTHLVEEPGSFDPHALDEDHGHDGWVHPDSKITKVRDRSYKDGNDKWGS